MSSRKRSRPGGVVRAARALPLLLVVLLAVAARAQATPPAITYDLIGTAGDGDWFKGPVEVAWKLNGVVTGQLGCFPHPKLDKDTPGAQLSCTAYSGWEHASVTTRPVRIDQTPPIRVTAALARPPDSAGWFTSPVAITWSGTDATSGIASCSTTMYAGPDAPSAAPAGTCRDRAGNVSAPVAVPLAYDATAPALSGLGVQLTGTSARVRWAAGPDTARLTVVRTPGNGGAPDATLVDGVPPAAEVRDDGLAPVGTYTWTVTARDAAGNAAQIATTAQTSPLLRWRVIPDANYYNVQLLRRGRTVLSAWPAHARFEVPRRWRFRGRTHRLVAGGYRWYVWAGYGPRARHRYGRLLAHGRLAIP